MNIGAYQLSLLGQRNRLLAERDKWRNLALVACANLVLAFLIIVAGGAQ
jgi:hypothetical protein